MGSETRDWQSETSNDRVTFSDGDLDEIVGSRVHLERMSGNQWFMSVTHDDGHQTAIWFKSKDLGKVMESREPVA